MAWAALVVGCADRGGDRTSSPPPTVVPAAQGSWQLPDPTWDRSGFERSLQAVLDDVIDVSAAPVLSAYEELFAAREPGCPEMSEESATRRAWAGNCVTSTGAAFSASGSDTDRADGAEVYLSGTLRVGDLSLSGRGHWSDTLLVAGDRTTHATRLYGPVRVTGADPDAWTSRSWTVDDLDVRRVVLEGRPTAVEVTGALGGLGTTFDAAELDLHLSDPATCAEPTGTVAMRLPPGRWFELRFDATTCDGCGQVWFRDEAVGEACVGFDRWTAWTGVDL
ncbi:MAG: hypothetical protein KC621_20655 [Myxococcales bacterium]|nr:hypothetical protein [Myxococcales bacterium]